MSRAFVKVPKKVQGSCAFQACSMTSVRCRDLIMHVQGRMNQTFRLPAKAVLLLESHVKHCEISKQVVLAAATNPHYCHNHGGPTLGEQFPKCCAS